MMIKLASTCAGAFISYMCFAFVNLSINPSMWSEWDRVGLLISISITILLSNKITLK